MIEFEKTTSSHQIKLYYSYSTINHSDYYMTFRLGSDERLIHGVPEEEIRSALPKIDHCRKPHHKLKSKRIISWVFKFWNCSRWCDLEEINLKICGAIKALWEGAWENNFDPPLGHSAKFHWVWPKPFYHPIIFHQSLIYVLRDFGLKRPLNNRLNGLLSLISRKSSPLRCGLTATRQNHHQYRYKPRGTMRVHPTWFTSLVKVRWGPEKKGAAKWGEKSYTLLQNVEFVLRLPLKERETSRKNYFKLL